VLSEIKNRGVADVCIVVCDGLKGLPDAVNTVWDNTIVQTCIVHLLRNSFRYASRRDWAAVAKDLKPVYTAPSEQAALDAFAEFCATWETRYPAIVRLWTNAWSEFVPFLQFDTHIRTVISTTNAIVIWSWNPGVRDVHDGAVRSRDLRAGRGYLPLSSTRVSGRFHVRSAGGDAVLAA
jgi:putative transposase